MTVDLYAVVVDGEVEQVYLYSQGVRYDPVMQTVVGGILKFSFDAPMIEDKTPAWTVAVEDGIRASDKVGG